MKFLPLVWKNVWRRKVRTIFTMLVVLVAFLLFGILMAVRQAFTMGIDVAGADRLMMLHRVGFMMLLPESYGQRVQTVPGVEFSTHQTWFGGVYQDPANFFAQMAVEPEPFFRVYPEFTISPEHMAAWQADRQGAIVGVDLMRRFNWSIGQRIPITGTIWQAKSGSTWEFNVVGTYDGGDSVDKTQFFFRYDYLNENRTGLQGAVGWYVVKIADPEQSSAVSQRIDELFANSSAETKTATEKAFVQSFAKQVGNIGAIMVAIATAVLFNMLLVAASTMTRSVRERTSELAVLKTLGFTNGTVLLLVFIESLVIVTVGGGAGLLAAWLFVQGGDPTGGMLPIFSLPTRDIVLGAALIVSLGLAAGVLPALGAVRLKITDALRRT